MADETDKTQNTPVPKRKREPRKRKVASVSNDVKNMQEAKMIDDDQFTQDDNLSKEEQITQSPNVKNESQSSVGDILKLGKAITKGAKGGKPTRLTLNVDATTYAKFRMMAVALDEDHGAVFQRAVESLERDLLSDSDE